MPGRNRHDESRSNDLAENLRCSICESMRQEKGYALPVSRLLANDGRGRLGVPHFSYPASHMGRRNDIPNGDSADDLIRNPLPA